MKKPFCFCPENVRAIDPQPLSRHPPTSYSHTFSRRKINVQCTYGKIVECIRFRRCRLLKVAHIHFFYSFQFFFSSFFVVCSILRLPSYAIYAIETIKKKEEKKTMFAWKIAFTSLRARCALVHVCICAGLSDAQPRPNAIGSIFFVISMSIQSIYSSRKMHEIFCFTHQFNGDRSTRCHNTQRGREGER